MTTEYPESASQSPAANPGSSTVSTGLAGGPQHVWPDLQEHGPKPELRHQIRVARDRWVVGMRSMWPHIRAWPLEVSRLDPKRLVPQTKVQ